MLLQGKHIRKVWGLPAVLALTTLALAAHSDLEKKYRTARQNIEAAAHGHYVQGLQAMENRFRAAGQPRELLTVRQERERYEKDRDMAQGAESGNGDVAELARKVQTWEKARMAELLQAYVARLEALVAELTRADKLNEALAVEKQLHTVKFELALYEAKLRKTAEAPPEKENALPATDPVAPENENVDADKKDGPVAGEDWTSPATRMKFVWIDAMKMWVGMYEVTRGEYRRKEDGHGVGNVHRQRYGHHYDGYRRPAVSVNFDDAKAYAEWLTQQDRTALNGARYRLPSEKEWMTYAQCRDFRTYPWGNHWPPQSGQAGNYHGQEGPGTGEKIPGYRDGFSAAAPVDRLWRNPWGLYGVGGNVWEACAKDDTGESFGAWRGASWNDGRRDDLRCSHRNGESGSLRDEYRGFRLVLSP
jgi:hypothetical protein